MWSISVKVKLFVLLLLPFLMVGCLNQKKIINKETAHQNERKIVLAMDRLMKSKQYVKAERYGRFFLTRFEHSPYVDDVSYRLAYLHVIADPQNPFFDYLQAKNSFEKFLEKFPSSQYAFACNNWLKVLYLTTQLKKQIADLKNEKRRLQNELQDRSTQIDQLKSTLHDLEKVIKR